MTACPRARRPSCPATGLRSADGSEQGLRSGGWFVVLHISYDTQYILYTLYYSKNKNYLLSDWNMLHVHRSKE